MQSEEGRTTDEVALHLPTGEVVLKSGRVMKPVQARQPAAQLGREIKSGRAAAATLEKVHRKLGDLPETTEKMNAIACVLMYTGVGLSDTDIAVALKTSADNIQRLKELDAYKQLAEMFDSTVFDDAKRQANHILAKSATHAAYRMIDAIDDAEITQNQLSAARDVLRLAGVGTDRVDEAKISNLNIKITRKGDADDVTVEINNAAS